MWDDVAKDNKAKWYYRLGSALYFAKRFDCCMLCPLLKISDGA